MTFIHPLLLSGLLLAGLPVLLHLILRQQPKRVPFPAFRFLIPKATSNRRKLQLRHWLLLLLRILMLALMCLALARPKVFSDRLNLAGDRPMVAVLVIDTSASMGYVVNGKSRLDEAKARALELIDGLPPDSRIAVLDPAEPGGEWQASTSSARERIAGLELRAAAGPLTDSVATAYRLFADLSRESGEDDPPPRFLYLLTDRTPASWDVARTNDLMAARDKLAGSPVNHAIIDLGIDKPADVAILDAKLKPQVVPANRPVVIPVTVQALGIDVDTQVQFRITGQPDIESKPVQLAAGKAKEVTFRRTGLKPGVYQAEIGLATTDALAADDVQYVTFEVREPRPVLILCDRVEDAAPLVRALKGNYACEVKTTAPPELTRYRAVCLVSVANVKPELWLALETFVAAGGGVAVFPGGDELDRASYNQGPGSRLLPATLKAVVTAPDEGQVWIEYQFQHPMIAPFRDDAQNPETGFADNPPRTYRYWDVEPAVGSQALVRYGDEKRRPAILETAFDRATVRGKVVMFTTPFDDRRDARDRGWNDYSQWWLYLVLSNRTLQYLGGSVEDAELNHVAGPAVRVVLPQGVKAATFTLVGPGLSAAETSVNRPDRGFEIRLPQPRSAGHYTLAAADRTWSASFSVNAPASEFQLLPRVPVESLVELFGPDAVLAPGQGAALKDKLDTHFRQPLELFPWLMLLLLGLFVAENYFANRFYRRENPA